MGSTTDRFLQSSKPIHAQWLPLPLQSLCLPAHQKKLWFQWPPPAHRQWGVCWQAGRQIMSGWETGKEAVVAWRAGNRQKLSQACVQVGSAQHRPLHSQTTQSRQLAVQCVAGQHAASRHVPRQGEASPTCRPASQAARQPACHPPLLRTTVAMSAGTSAVPTFVLRSSMPSPASSGNLLSAAFTLFTYVCREGNEGGRRVGVWVGERVEWVGG